MEELWGFHKLLKHWGCCRNSRQHSWRRLQQRRDRAIMWEAPSQKCCGTSILWFRLLTATFDLHDLVDKDAVGCIWLVFLMLSGYMNFGEMYVTNVSHVKRCCLNFQGLFFCSGSCETGLREEGAMFFIYIITSMVIDGQMHKIYPGDGAQVQGKVCSITFLGS